MKLVSVRCPSCGSNVEVDEYSKSFTCKYCNVTTVIEKDAFNKNYNDDSIKQAEMLIDTNQDYDNAKFRFKNITTSDPKDPRAWLGLVRCYTRDLKEKMYIYVEGIAPIWLAGMEGRVLGAYNKYLEMESKEEAKTNVKKIFDEYYNTNKNEYNKIKENYGDTEQVITYEPSKEYSETIKAENKIITSESLKEIIDLMHERLIMYQKISDAEKKKNEFFDFYEREFSFEDDGSQLVFNINFYDNTNVSIDNYDNFVNVYETRLHEIKDFSADFKLSYSIDRPEPNKFHEHYYQYIDLFVSETKLKINVKLDSADNKLNDLYQKLKDIILSAPEKYDFIVKKRGLVSLAVTLGTGLIFGTLLGAIPLFSEVMRNLYFNTIILYPIISIILGTLIGTFISSMLLSGRYKNILPERRYAGYRDGKSVYEDDVESYINTSEILIGSKSNNNQCRKEIKDIYEKYKSMIKYELILLGLITLLIFILSRF